MKRVFHASAVVAVALALFVGSGCSSNDNKTTNPPVAKELDSGDLIQTATYPHRFFTAGTYAYHCVHHTNMHGSVVVSDGAPAADTSMSVLIQGLAFTPATITLHTGGKVVWTNNDIAVHTVTSD